MSETASVGTLWSTITLVGVFVVLLALVPSALRWAQQRGLVRPGGAVGDGRLGGLNVVQAVAVGPQQKVVTVETGPPQARVWLVLGVTAHQVSLLHVMPQPPAPALGVPLQTAGAPARSFAQTLQQQHGPEAVAEAQHDARA
jgi:flagellar protein FliO/FliZ